MMKKMVFALLALAASLSLCLGAARAADYAVVDVQKIFSESKPGKAGAAHMKKVQEVLQKGLDDVAAQYKGRENTPEGQRAIVEAQQVLNRQLALEQQAVNVALDKELRAAVAEWMKKNKKIVMVMPKHLTLGNTGIVEFTTAVMNEMNKRTAKFPDLPKVTINKPAPAAKK